MQLLTRYIIGQFIRYFLTINLAFVAMYLLIDFFEKYDSFLETDKSLGVVLKFFMLNIPFIVDQLGPVLTLLSGVITLGILNHTNELTALKAAGIPLKRIIRPILMAAMSITVIYFTAAQFILPKTISVTNKIWYEDVRGKVPLGIFRNGRYYFKGKEGFYSFKWPNKEKLAFRTFSYSTWDEEYNVNKVLVAEFAEWVPPIWILRAGQLEQHSKDGTYETELFVEKGLELPETPQDFLIPEYQTAELSLVGLFTAIGDQPTEAQEIAARADFYSRVSYLLLGLPLLLVGLPVLLLSYQKWGRDLSVAVPVSCGIAFVAWGTWGALQSLAKNGYVYALPAAFSIHIIFSLIGIYLLLKQDT
ncbi:MAG: YjgP/YjgQ family permease [Desulfobulbaceae bacterium]|nr:MAG: YjgP/YjgQ family permease [Desulfobulbaceae bacterium]